MRYFVIAAGFVLALAGMFALGTAQAADTVESDGKCWTNVSNGNWAWAECKGSGKSHHHKG